LHPAGKDYIAFVRKVRVCMDGWQFWMAAGVLLLITGGILMRALRRAMAGAPPPAAFDLQVYRDQLAEIDRDLARDSLPPDEADRMRTEVSRRMLGADRQMTDPVVAQTGHSGLLALLMGVMLAASVGGYVWLGAPGYPDLPLAARIAEAEARRADRPDQATAEAQINLPAPPAPDAEYANLVKRLRDAVKESPDDVTGLRLLAINEAALGNFTAARLAQQALIAAKGNATTAQDYADLAELLIAATGGYVSPQAEDILEPALLRDPDNGTARYYAGLMMWQAGRYDLGFRFWRPLIDGPADAAWMAALRAQIEDMAYRAGVEFTLPPPSGMTPEDMVAQLSNRLATTGGPPEDWARLITALRVLGNTEQSNAILAEARRVFAAAPDALATIEAAAP
jgi:cytochrome c-type biogenesis protein CcmH